MLMRGINALLGTLPNTFHIVKKRDHYFLYDGPTRVVCVGGNSSKQNDYLDKVSRLKLEKYLENAGVHRADRND